VIASRPAEPYRLGSTATGSADRLSRTAAVKTLFSWVAMLIFVIPARTAATRSWSDGTMQLGDEAEIQDRIAGQHSV